MLGQIPIVTRITAMSANEKPIWDLPVRISHWGLAVSFFGAFYSSELDPMVIHLYFAYAAITFAIFRLFWGFIGSENARFVNFVKGVGAARDYFNELKNFRHREYWGHNPLGALAVVSIILLMIATVAMGLFAKNRALTGPWADSVSRSTERVLNDGHSMLASILMTIVVIHIAAIVFYRFVLHDNLIKPMVTGTRAPKEEHPAPRFASIWLAIGTFAVSAAISGAMFRFWFL